MAGQLRSVSVALPSSILLNAQSPELRVYLAGQVARAVAIFRVHEVVIFDERALESTARRPHGAPDDASALFARVLRYLETPQYLRKHLFPVCAELRLVGLLNPLALPSHVARTDCVPFREGVAVSRSSHRGSPANLPPTRYVDVGLPRLVEVDRPVAPTSRVTVDMKPSGDDYGNVPGKYLFGRLVHRDNPRAEHTYWGYQVRTAKCLSEVFTNSLVCDKYDLVIGTSERGTPIDVFAQDAAFPPCNNLLIVFGGVQGLEHSVIGDKRLEQLNVSSDPTKSPQSAHPTYSVADLFDFYINTCPHQGSRTIRTEEALLISLAALQPFINNDT